MSSNAFARSRPRVRHQRVPRGNSSCDHPRFLQLVNELARINDAKKKQEEAEGGGGGGGGGSSGVNLAGGTGCATDCTEDEDNGNICSGISHNGNSSSCCDTAEAQTSNGFRSLDSNQAASTLHDNYHHHHQLQQQQNHHHQHHHLHQQPQQQLIQHHQLQIHHHQQQHLDLQQHLNGNNDLHQNRCQPNDHISKNSSTNFGYSKQNLVDEQQHSSDFSNNSLDLRQDENRSKRKRSSNESSINSKRNSSSTTCGSSGGGSSKRHKSASDAIRPLSPSFTKCPICLLDSMDRDPSFTNTCFHLFCFVCIENWTKNKATCPLCRTKFTKIIFNIKSASVYDEKTASPIRRDDDDGYIADRLMLEHLSGLNPTSTVSTRNANSDDVQFLFENLRNPEVLMPQYFVNQMDPRQGESLHSFNAVSATTNFNSNVPHAPFTPTSYPITPNYIALFPPNRIAPTTNSAITSAYTANTSLTNINNDPSSSRRISRSGRYIYTRNYERPIVDANSRVTRTANGIRVDQGVPLERHHHPQQQHQHQHQHQHQSHHPHHHSHQHAQHRSTIDMSPRHNQRIEQSHTHISLPYPIQPRHFNPTAYISRPFNNAQIDHHQQILDTLYRQMPDM